MQNIGHLTNGQIPSLQHITEERIESLVGAKIDYNPAKDPSPIYAPDGQALVDLAGKPIMPSWQHTSALSEYLLEGLKVDKDIEKVSDLKGLPLPYWKSSHSLVFTADGMVLLAVRGKANANGPGQALHFSAGYDKPLDGRPETPAECLAREMEEETGLSLQDIAKKAPTDLGVLENWAVAKFNVKLGDDKKLCRIASHEHVYAIQSHMTADEIAKMVRCGREAIGFISLKFQDVPALNTGSVPVTFWPSSVLSDYPGGSGITTRTTSLSELAAYLNRPETTMPQNIENGSCHLGAPVTMLACKDNFTYRGSTDMIGRINSALTILYGQKRDPGLPHPQA